VPPVGKFPAGGGTVVPPTGTSTAVGASLKPGGGIVVPPAGTSTTVGASLKPGGGTVVFPTGESNTVPASLRAVPPGRAEEGGGRTTGISVAVLASAASDQSRTTLTKPSSAICTRALSTSSKSQSVSAPASAKSAIVAITLRCARLRSVGRAPFVLNASMSSCSILVSIDWAGCSRASVPMKSSHASCPASVTHFLPPAATRASATRTLPPRCAIMASASSFRAVVMKASTVPSLAARETISSITGWRTPALRARATNSSHCARAANLCAAFHFDMTLIGVTPRAGFVARLTSPANWLSGIPSSRAFCAPRFATSSRCDCPSSRTVSSAPSRTPASTPSRTPASAPSPKSLTHRDFHPLRIAGPNLPAINIAGASAKSRAPSMEVAKRITAKSMAMPSSAANRARPAAAWTCRAASRCSGVISVRWR